ncbi:NTP transferase domain-containing protein [Thermodesulfobacteriota bacterium]
MTTQSLPQVIILLAGMGSRLGRPYPKSLTSLENGETILSRQIRILQSFGLAITAVIGFKKDLIMEAAPDIRFCYNPNFDTTNTSKSLLSGIRHMAGHDVLWLNGDVVFDAEIIELMLNSDSSAVAVNNARVAEEEVKYTLNHAGYINNISKTVENPLGEALGINLVKKEYLDDFMKYLEDVDENDYFERAMELLIQEKSYRFKAIDVGNHNCVEVDFADDLKVAKAMVQSDQQDKR